MGAEAPIADTRLVFALAGHSRLQSLLVDDLAVDLAVNRMLFGDDNRLGHTGQCTQPDRKSVV